MKEPAGELRALRAIRNVYGANAERRKRDLLAALGAHPPRSVSGLARYHDDLLFLRAFPGDPKTLQCAVRALSSIEPAFGKLPAAEREALEFSGVAGSKVRYVFPYEIARWLVRRVPGEVDFDWVGYDASRLDPLLKTLMRASEREGYDSGEYALRTWIKSARRVDTGTDLQWVIEALAARTAQQSAIDDLWAAAEPVIVWSLSGSRFSATRHLLRGMPTVLRRAMRRPPENPARRIAAPSKNVTLLPASRARQVIEATRIAISARGREVVSMTYANPAEVHWCELGEGVALAVIGVPLAQRMMLEANYGYLLVSNGVPIGYGGVTPLYRQANTGMNLFDPFRGSEAAFIWMETLRAFHTLFGVRRFILNGYQFGEGNAEAINSGAYWFYYHLGFRPAAPDLRKLAEREAARLGRPGAAKSSKTTLKALAQGDLHLDLPGWNERDFFDEALLPRFGAAAARALSAEPVASRALAEKRVAEKLAAALGVKSTNGWPANERRAFEFLAPIAAIVPNPGRWSPDDRRSLIHLMRAKGRAQERNFALEAHRNQRFFRALAKQLTKE